MLDFGLAKALDTTPEGDPSQSPTLTAAATQMGVIMGTAAYMSPEQARGKPVDKRADIWSFGCVLYEMLTGQRAFAAEDVSTTLARVLEHEPDYAAVAPNLNPRILETLERCLEKNAANRYRDIGDVGVDLRRAQADPRGLFPKPLAEDASGLAGSRWQLVAALFLVAGISAFAGWAIRPGGDAAFTPTPLRFQIDTPDQNQVSGAALSPDGETAAFVTSDGASSYLWVRPLTELDARLVADIGSPGGGAFWSPDSRRFAAVSGSTLRGFDVSGGTGTDITDFPAGFRGGAWNADDVIVLGSTAGLWTVPAEGGAATALTTVAEQERAHARPLFLPDGRHFAYTRVRTAPAQSAVYIGSHDDPEVEIEVPAAGVVGYIPAFGSDAGSNSGYLVYVDQGRPMGCRSTARHSKPQEARSRSTPRQVGSYRFPQPD